MLTGTLYIVATPIGNLEDVTLRAISILKDVDIVLAEDTRVTKKFLDFVFSHYSLSQPDSQRTTHYPQLFSYHQHSGESVKHEILNFLLIGKKIALVTDAGTPGISDPGNELVEFVRTYAPEVSIVPVPGPSALTTALSVCGFNVSKFVFLGFLPKKKRTKLFDWLKKGPSARSTGAQGGEQRRSTNSGRTFTFAFYESPNRILKTLSLVQKEFGPEIRIFIARELTKLYETLYWGKVAEVIEKLSQDKVKGEIVVVVEI